MYVCYSHLHTCITTCVQMYKKVQLRNLKIGLVGKVKKAKELLGNIDELGKKP